MAYSVDRYSSNLFDPAANFPINIADNTINSTSTSLRLFGRGVTNYGEIVAESFVHMLENFAGVAAPTNPITGQLWWEQDPANSSSTQKLHVWNGSGWKAVSGATTGPTAPTGPSQGDLWYDTTNKTFNVWDNGAWRRIYLASEKGLPTNPSATAPTSPIEGMLWYNTSSDVLSTYNGTIWEGLMKTRPESGPTSDTWVSYENINGHEVIMITVDGTILAIWSAANIPLGSLWNGVTPAGKPNLQGLYPNGLNVGLNFSNVSDNGISGNNSVHHGSWGLAPGATVEATYADIAERYEADEPLEPGTLVSLGGSKEVTKTTKLSDISVFGVVSTQPAYILNSGAGDNQTHPAIALVGRVPVKVTGKVKKGDRLISSSVPGVATVYTFNPTDTAAAMFAVFGRALHDKDDEGIGLVEATIGAK